MFQSPPCESCDSGVPIPPPYHVISGVPIPSISCSQSPSYHVKGSIQMFQSPPSKSCDSGVPIPSISCDSGFPIPLHDHRCIQSIPLGMQTAIPYKHWCVPYPIQSVVR
ncbi:unnamed protein product [Staurois parvus]|uniref:Uncharacterized protein n=1 Tax=Staurois parvus TaxID=386267 RepID=A0ABN9EYP7_9NEOB|nr:unnamed protein product [Staurois parvus]